MTKRKKKNIASKSGRKIAKIQEKTYRKSSYFIEERKTLTFHQHRRFMQNFENLEKRVKPKLNGNGKTKKHISDKPRHTSLHFKEPSNKKTAGFPR
jgi:hypothetical protein